MPIIRRPLTPPPAPAPTLPASFLRAGFVPPDQARIRGNTKFRGLMLATEGRSDTGKTEFVLSAPGPGVILACDRGFDAVFDNQAPPPSRRTDFGIKTLAMPSATDFGSARDYLPYYQTFYREAMNAIAIPEARTVCIDGDNFSWDLQRLAEWGKLQGIYPQTKYAEPKAARMSFYYKLWESGKIIITTNMMQDEWKDQLDANGLPIVDEKGERRRERTGDSVAKGYPDQEYLWQIRIRHLYRGPRIQKMAFGPKKGQEVRIPGQWGIRITKCKSNADLVGTELWGDECNFSGLMQTVYPHLDLSVWGF